MQLGEKRLAATIEDLDMARKHFFASQITKNNSLNEDNGVNHVLEALDSPNPLKAIQKHKDIKKPQLVATLGFFHLLDFNSAQNRFKGIKVEELTSKIIEKCHLMLPEICKTCNKIYSPDIIDQGAACFICTKGMCPACCPINNSSDGFLTSLFPVCGACCNKHKHKYNET